LAQAGEVVDRLASIHDLPRECFEIIHFATKGDQLRDQPLPEIGVKGLFTKELEERLLTGELDMAVHSAKDVATSLPEGLLLSAFLPREDVRDVFLSRSGFTLSELPPGAIVGTSSVRRHALVAMHRPDVEIVPFRGSVGSRLQKLEQGGVDATLLALAGLKRLGISDGITQIFSTREFPPSPAQGAICIETAVVNRWINELVSAVDDVATADAVKCERAFLRTLDGSCRTPIGAYAVCSGSEIILRGMTIQPDGAKRADILVRGERASAEAVGIEAGRHALCAANS
jgi:hydroxymethylbilane synthase